MSLKYHHCEIQNNENLSCYISREKELSEWSCKLKSLQNYSRRSSFVLNVPPFQNVHASEWHFLLFQGVQSSNFRNILIHPSCCSVQPSLTMFSSSYFQSSLSEQEILVSFSSLNDHPKVT